MRHGNEAKRREDMKSKQCKGERRSEGRVVYSKNK